MSPEEFIARWRGTTRTRAVGRSGTFPRSVCTPRSTETGRLGSAWHRIYLEKSTRKIGDAAGFADVWKRHCFAWEYKGNHKNLVQAYAQLKQYADALANPPLLIVSDMQEIRVHTNFTNAIAQEHSIGLPDLVAPEKRELLRHCFVAPERLRPDRTRESVTAEAATRFASIAVGLRQRHDERRVAHFINKLVFCLFAEDIDLLPERVFAYLLDEAAKHPDNLEAMLSD